MKLLTGIKKENSKLIVELFNSENESLKRAAGNDEYELLTEIKRKFQSIKLEKKPLMANGYRQSEGTGDFIPCKKIEEEIIEKIEIEINKLIINK